MMEKTLSIALPENLYNALAKIAKKEDRSKGYIMRQVLERYIEDYMDVQIGEKTLKDINENKTELVDFDDMMKKYGLES